MTDEGWFEGLDPEDHGAAVTRIREGQAETPADWPKAALEQGFAGDRDEYYDRLHE
jgi:nucleolar protein 56